MARSPREVLMAARAEVRILDHNKYHTNAGSLELILADIRKNALAILNVGWRGSGPGFAGTASILMEKLSLIRISFCNSLLLLILAIIV